MGLQQYRAKRDFRKTAEPSGVAPAGKAAGAGGRFVMHKHAATRLHYDLRLEHDGVLWSWAVTRGPSLDPSERRLAVHVEDHPLDYGSFEGNIPKGQYGGGAVVLWDEGVWRPEGDPAKGMKKGHIRFEIEGRKLKGDWHLVRLKPRPGEKRENWLLIKSDDEFADTHRDILEEMPKSVKTGRTIEEVAENKPPKKTKAAKKESSSAKGAAAKLPDFIPPCLARLESRPPAGEDWIHEVKFDGYRLQAHVAEGKVRLYTRTGLDWTEKFGAPVAEALGALDCASAVVDGEVVVLQENGVSNFSALQLALSEGRPADMVFFAFDLLHLNGKSLLDEPLLERKERLQALLGQAGEGHLRYSEHFAAPGQAMLDNACELGLEGIVSKRSGAPYRSGRGYDWIKSKCTLRQEFVIAGYLPSDKTGRGLRSLIMSYYEDGELKPAGNVGTGFTADVLRDLKKKLDPLRIKSPPFAGLLARQKGAVWVKPELVAEVEFRTWTHDGLIRHASYQGLRADKPAKEVIAETRPGVTRPAKAAPEKKPPSERTAKPPKTSVKLSNPTKKLWPEEGVSKKDLLDHYALVWPRMKQFVVDRPLSLVRAPDGVGGQRFFQKHSMQGMPDKIFTSHDPEDNEEVLYIRDFDGLAGLVQLGVVEVHIWGSKVETIGQPDQIVFDLDPDEGLGIEDVRAAAFEVREKLEELGFTPFLKTSGGKGFHVVAPLKPKADWDEVKGFANDFARALAQGAPERYTATMSKKARTGRIFLDYLRNGRGSTTVAPYSSRAKKGATMSMPITWEMLEAGVGPADFRIGEDIIAERLAADDPWKDFFRKGKALKRR